MESTSTTGSTSTTADPNRAQAWYSGTAIRPPDTGQMAGPNNAAAADTGTGADRRRVRHPDRHGLTSEPGASKEGSHPPRANLSHPGHSDTASNRLRA